MKHLNHEETMQFLLKIFRSYKAFARKEEYERTFDPHGLSPYKVIPCYSYDDAVNAAVIEGLLVRNKAGAVSLPRAEVMATHARLMQSIAESRAEERRAFSAWANGVRA